MMSNNEICVPASAVESYGGEGEGEGDHGVPPAEGDEVEVTVKGKVSRIEGGNVYFTPTEANGQPISEHEKPGDQPGDNEPDTDESMDALMSASKEGGGY